MPFNDLNLRGTRGKSFKATSLNKIYQPKYVALYQAFVRGQVLPLCCQRHPDLRAEKSRSWTLGGYAPVRHLGLRISPAYFNIDYTDRVVNPISSFSTGLTMQNMVPSIIFLANSIAY